MINGMEYMDNMAIVFAVGLVSGYFSCVLREWIYDRVHKDK